MHRHCMNSQNGSENAARRTSCVRIQCFPRVVCVTSETIRQFAMKTLWMGMSRKRSYVAHLARWATRSDASCKQIAGSSVRQWCKRMNYVTLLFCFLLDLGQLAIELQQSTSKLTRNKTIFQLNSLFITHSWILYCMIVVLKTSCINSGTKFRRILHGIFVHAKIFILKEEFKLQSVLKFVRFLSNLELYWNNPNWNSNISIANPKNCKSKYLNNVIPNLFWIFKGFFRGFPQPNCPLLIKSK